MEKSWYVFETEALALQAEAQVSALMKCPLSDQSETMVTMSRWAVPRQTTTGSWAFEVPTKPEHQIAATVVGVVAFPDSMLFPNTPERG